MRIVSNKNEWDECLAYIRTIDDSLARQGLCVTRIDEAKHTIYIGRLDTEIDKAMQRLEALLAEV